MYPGENNPNDKVFHDRTANTNQTRSQAILPGFCANTGIGIIDVAYPYS
jgi:hypothetical protein